MKHMMYLWPDPLTISLTNSAGEPITIDASALKVGRVIVNDDGTVTLEMGWEKKPKTGNYWLDQGDNMKGQYGYGTISNIN